MEELKWSHGCKAWLAPGVLALTTIYMSHKNSWGVGVVLQTYNDSF